MIRDAFVDTARQLLDAHGLRFSEAIGLLVAVGHEELTWLRFGRKKRGEDSFAETLSDELPPIAGSLYGAVRDGLAHGWAPQPILIGQTRVFVGFRLTDQGRAHFVSRRQLGELLCEGPEEVLTIALDLRTLVDGLAGEFDRLETDMASDPRFHDEVERRSVKGRTRSVKGPEYEAWKQFIPDDLRKG